MLDCLQASSLVELAICVARRMPQRGSNGYALPDARTRTEWQSLVRTLLAGQGKAEVPPSLRGIYALHPFHDSTTGREYSVLLEVADENGDGVVDRGWGTLVVLPRWQRPLQLQVAHPLSDGLTLRQSVMVFESVGAHSLLFAGARRDANLEPSPCQPRYYRSDVAHNPESLFHAATEAVLEFRLPTGGPLDVLQFHGMDDGTCREVDVFISTGVALPTQPGARVLQLRESLRRRNPGWSIKTPGDPLPCDLSGSTNVQGRLLNGVPAARVCQTMARASSGRFVHVEQKRVCREAACWIEAVADAWPTASPAAIAGTAALGADRPSLA